MREQTGRPRTEGGTVNRAKIVTAAVSLLCVTTLVAAVGGSGALPTLFRGAAELSAQMTIPHGGTEVMGRELGSLQAALAKKEENTEPGGESGGIGSPSPSSSSGGAASSSGGASSGEGSSGGSVSSVSGSTGSSSAGRLPVQTMTMKPPVSSRYVQFGNVWVYNQTASHSADIKNQLAIRPDVHINLKKGPQVLIIHTHTTESFAQDDTGTYDPNYPTRNPDRSKSVCAVGDKITQELEKNGIGVIHDTAYHDYPSYSNAYGKMYTDEMADLKKYPSIQVVLDVHRDAIQYTDGTRLKPTVVVNGKKAAQIMVVSACDEPGTALPVPDWQWNYRFGLRIQQQLANTYPNFARPLNLAPMRYNMQVSHGALLVEFGTDVNTLDEVTYSGQLFGQELSKVLLGLQG